MPSFGPVASSPVSGLPIFTGVVSATAAFVGVGSFSPAGRVSAVAVASIGGAGQSALSGASTAIGLLSVAGSSAFHATGGATAAAAFALSGAGQVTAKAYVKPSPERTVILPFVSRSIAITRGSRTVEPLAFDRSVSAQRLARTIIAAAA